MLTKRIIPCLDVHAGRVVKGVNFVNLRDAGDPVEIAKAYDKAGADEVTFLDITASSDNRATVVDMVRQVAANVFIPFTVGGGIRTVDDFRLLLREGADKISVNSAAGNTRTYTLNVFRSYSTDNTLRDLIISDGSLEPAFDPEVTNYTVTLDDDLAFLDKISVIGIKNDKKASITGNGEYQIKTGNNEIKITVKSESGDEREQEGHLERLFAYTADGGQTLPPRDHMGSF